MEWRVISVSEERKKTDEEKQAQGCGEKNEPHGSTPKDAPVQEPNGSVCCLPKRAVATECSFTILIEPAKAVIDFPNDVSREKSVKEQ